LTPRSGHGAGSKWGCDGAGESNKRRAGTLKSGTWKTTSCLLAMQAMMAEGELLLPMQTMVAGGAVPKVVLSTRHASRTCEGEERSSTSPA